MRQYYVKTIDGLVIGPILADELVKMVASGKINEGSMMREGVNGPLMSLHELAKLDGAEETIKRVGAKSSVREMQIGCLMLFCVGLAVVGLGELIVPFLVFLAVAVGLGFVFGKMIGQDVLAAPGWNKMGKKPSKASFLQFVALVVGFAVGFLVYGTLTDWRYFGG